MQRGILLRKKDINKMQLLLILVSVGAALTVGILPANSETLDRLAGKYGVDDRLNDIWVLTMFNHQPLNRADFVKGLPAVAFHLNDNRVSGSTGCNRITGGFEARGKTITFGQMATTRMACPNMAFEQNFLTALTGNKLTYTIGKVSLILTDDEGMVMEFKKTD